MARRVATCNEKFSQTEKNGGDPSKFAAVPPIAPKDGSYS
jgi:hypothetical protein